MLHFHDTCNFVLRSDSLGRLAASVVNAYVVEAGDGPDTYTPGSLPRASGGTHIASVVASQVKTSQVKTGQADAC